MNGNTMVVTESESQNGGTESYTVQPDWQFKCTPQKHNGLYKVGQFALPCFLIVLYIALLAFMLIMTYRFVRAVEKIAKKFEAGITINKNNSNLDDRI